jgi:MOSC domain-containing protein YiiM
MSIEGIFLSPKASLPMQCVETGTLVEGKGLEGDRYCTLSGTYSHIRVSKLYKGQREPGRQLTLVSADSVEAALKRNGLEALGSLGDLRRNIVVRGLSCESLLAAIGQVVKLGPTCRVLIHRQSVPCMYNERKNCIPGMMKAIWNESGVSCEVLTGGPIGVGDVVEILDEKGKVDDGNQPPGYYVPPSRRTTEMVTEAIKRKREEKKMLLEICDPEGVARVEASYGTVGLTFWPRDKE